MDIDQYQRAVVPLFGRRGMDSQMLMACLGIASEAGEICDALRNHLYRYEPLDVHSLKLEIGDVVSNLAYLAATFQWDLSEILDLSLQKLQERHGHMVESTTDSMRGRHAPSP